MESQLPQSFVQSSNRALPVPPTANLKRQNPFPVKYLTPLLRDAALAIVDYVDCPTSLAAMSVLAAASLAVGARPQPLLKPFLTCNDPTIEGLFTLFSTGRPSIGLFSDEGATFIGGYGMSVDNRLKTAANLCQMWDASTLKRVRVNADDTYLMVGRRLAFHLMMQPTVATKMYAMEDTKNQGLYSRLLLSYPESTMGTHWTHENKPESETHLGNL